MTDDAAEDLALPQDPAEDAVGDTQDDEPPNRGRERLRPRWPAQIVVHSLSISTGYGGLCLKFVRTCANIGPRYGSAKEAWAEAAHKHPGHADAPPGAFVFLSHPKSRYGHVAVYLGDGRIRTTNSATNRIHSDPISRWVGWGYTLQGWTEDLNGVRVPGMTPVVPDVVVPGGVVLGRGARGPAVGTLQRGLNRMFPAYSNLGVDNSYGPRTAAVVAEFQRRCGLPATGDVDTATRDVLARHGIHF